MGACSISTTRGLPFRSAHFRYLDGNKSSRFMAVASQFRMQSVIRAFALDAKLKISFRARAACRGLQTAKPLALALARCNDATCRQETLARGRSVAMCLGRDKAVRSRAATVL